MSNSGGKPELAADGLGPEGPVDMAERSRVRGPAGIGGWLLLFLGLVAINAAWEFVVLGQYVIEAMEAPRDSLSFLVIVLAFYRPVTALLLSLIVLRWMIQVRRWSSVWLAFICLCVMLVGIPISAALVPLILFDWDLGFDPIWISPVTTGIFIAFSAGWYLFSSRRVANTYPRYPDPAPIFE